MTTDLPRNGLFNQSQIPGNVIDFDEMARVIIENYHLRSAHAAPEIRNWNMLKMNLLCAEFSIDWSDNTRAFPLPDSKASALLSVMASFYDKLQSPMAGFFEYSPVPGETEILDRHINSIDQATETLKQQWRAMFRDLLALRWPEAVAKTTTTDRLRELGLGQRPDPDDFF